MGAGRAGPARVLATYGLEDAAAALGASLSRAVTGKVALATEPPGRG